MADYKNRINKLRSKESKATNNNNNEENANVLPSDKPMEVDKAGGGVQPFVEKEGVDNSRHELMSDDALLPTQQSALDSNCDGTSSTVTKNTESEGSVDQQQSSETDEDDEETHDIYYLAGTYDYRDRSVKMEPGVE